MNNLVLTDKYRIDVANGKFKLNGNNINVSDVAYIRYRFEDYSLSDTLDYLKATIKKFYLSSHLIEVKLSEHCGDDINSICDELDNVIAFLYIDVDDIDVENESLSEHKLELLKQFKDSGAFVERVMLKDKSSSLYTISGNRLREQVSELLGVKTEDIGFCQSPLSLCDGNCCLTAERARRLSAMYNEYDSASLPSSNHELKNSNNCGCIKHHIIENDLILDKASSEVSVKKEISNVVNIKKSKGIREIIAW